MANNSDNSGLYFIVGALVVAVGLGAYFYMNNNTAMPVTGSAGDTTNIQIERNVNPPPAPVSDPAPDFRLDIERR